MGSGFSSGAFSGGMGVVAGVGAGVWVGVGFGVGVGVATGAVLGIGRVLAGRAVVPQAVNNDSRSSIDRNFFSIVVILSQTCWQYLYRRSVIY